MSKGAATMNGHGFRSPERSAGPSAYAPSSMMSPDSPPPPSRVLLDGYQDALRSPPDERHRFNPLNKSRPRSSGLLDVNDPVAMHLLVETALGDGQEYEVLSYEEIDELKKELSLLNNRIEASRRKLAMESKVRDAAQSLGRLKKGSESPQRQRRSFLGGRKSETPSADDEYAVSERKCEELAQELWRLEKRANDLNRRLLQHTAGVLQMTHRGIIKNEANGSVQFPPAESKPYPYSHAGVQPATTNDDIFDHRSLYQNLDDATRSVDGLSSESAQQVSEAEKKLEGLNGRLREMIVKVNPQLRTSYQAPPRFQANGAAPRPGTSIRAQIEYLEESLATVDRQQATTTRDRSQAEQGTKERLRGINMQLLEVINSSHIPPPRGQLGQVPSSERPLQEQLGYLEEGLDAVEQQMSAAKKGGDQQSKVEQIETVLVGLWQIIVSGEEEARQRKRQRAQARSSSANGMDGDSDVSPEEDPVPHEEFSLQAFSAKVQWLYARATSLREQKNILRRQIKQQRQLNSKSDAARDGRVSELEQELERTHQALDESDREAMNARQELSVVMQRLETARRDWSQRDKQRDEDKSQSQEELRRLQASLDQTRDAHGEHGAKLQTLERDLQSARQEREASMSKEAELRQELEEKTRQLAESQKEMEGLEGELVRLQTEVTVARAELDGAYGTRAQRAAEVAANPAMQKELDELKSRNAALTTELAELQGARDAAGSGSAELQGRVQTLQQELSDTITDYEAMTKQIIEFEKERESLESTVDGLRDRCEALETELGDERVKWMGIKSPGVDGADGGPPSQSTSTTVLKNEFKKMMRDTRAENQKALRAEQEERRRLEALVRTLRKEQGSSASASASTSPGRSNLSQSTRA